MKRLLLACLLLLPACGVTPLPDPVTSALAPDFGALHLSHRGAADQHWTVLVNGRPYAETPTTPGSDHLLLQEVGDRVCITDGRTHAKLFLVPQVRRVTLTKEGLTSPQVPMQRGGC